MVGVRVSVYIEDGVGGSRVWVRSRCARRVIARAVERRGVEVTVQVGSASESALLITNGVEVAEGVGLSVGIGSKVGSWVLLARSQPAIRHTAKANTSPTSDQRAVERRPLFFDKEVKRASMWVLKIIITHLDRM